MMLKRFASSRLIYIHESPFSKNDESRLGTSNMLLLGFRECAENGVSGLIASTSGGKVR